MDVNVSRRQGDFLVRSAFQGAESGVTALYGPSGAGKTSIVNMVSGLVRPDTGRIVVNGHCLFDAVRRIDLPPEQRRIGYVFQDGRLFPHFSVKTNLLYGMRLTPRKIRFVNFDPVVELLGIGNLLHRRPAKLSGGEKQRVAIGRALLSSPAMLLMDEPLASLDTSRKEEVLPFIVRLSREFSIPILYVSHAMDEILNLADHLVVLKAGTVAACGEMVELLSRPELQSLFGKEDIGAFIQARVELPKDAFGLTHLICAGNTLKVPPISAPRGTLVRVRIASRHVGISLSPPEKTSFQNVFSGRVDTIVDHGEAFVNLRLNIGSPLWAKITRHSFRELDLKIGQPIFALIKSVAISSGGDAYS